MSSVDSAPHDATALADAMGRDGFVLLPGVDARDAFADHGHLTDWDAFAASWNRLDDDAHMGDRGHYRQRRHAVYAADAGGRIVRQPHQPHYQSRAYNRLNGGVERWFAPIEAHIADGSTLQTVLRCCLAVFGAARPDVADWHVEVHQFRIRARAAEAGQPTPEGVHRDGVDHVLVLMVQRENIEQGTTTVYAPDHRELGSFTLTRPLDTTWLDDHRVYHGVTAVRPLDPEQPAHRDVLVVTFRDAATSPDDARFSPDKGMSS